VRALDTNVLARLILQDDDLPTRVAEAAVRDPFWVTLTVWVELGWLLYKRLGLDRLVVAEALQTIATIETAHMSDPDGIGWAIAQFRHGADWADMIHVVAAKDAADRFATFDAGIAHRIGDDTPMPIETLR
jgi:predicted nucleic-acid-binding protein